MPLSTGDPGTIGAYALMDRLGSGGMGVVYLARSATGRKVAVKLVHAQLAEDDEFRIRFRQEIAAARKVSGAFTAPVLDADPDAERPWMATLYVPGPTLSERVRDGGPLTGAELRGLALGLTEALRDIHRAGVVHRDLKPANVLIAEDGPRVIDFGISRAADNQSLTMTGRVIGTPPFMSPEQLRSARDVTPASDVFSLGSLLAYAAGGRSPFEADSPYLSGYQVMYEEPGLDEVPERLRAIVERCLVKDPQDRPDLMELHRLFRALPDEDAPAPVRRTGADAPRTGAGAPRTGADAPRDDTEPAAGGRTPARRRVLTAAGAALAVAGTIAAGVWAFDGDPSRREGAAAASSTVPELPAPSLPKGWQPWETVVPGTVSNAPLDYGMPGCRADAGALYCGADGYTLARIDAATGRIAWKISRTTQNARPVGVRDGQVYYFDETDQSGEGSGVQLRVLDTDTGKERWARQITAASTATLFDGGALTVSPDESQFVAYDTAGGELWRSAVPGGAYCELREAGGVPYAECWGQGAPTESRAELLRIDPRDGSYKVLATLPAKAQLLGTLDGDLLFTAPESEEVNYSYDYEEPWAALLRVDPETADVRRLPLPKDTRGAVTVQGRVAYFMKGNGTVTALSAETGARLWKRSTEMEGLSAPVLSETYGRVYFTTRFGRVLALRAKDGAEAWRTQTPDLKGVEYQNEAASVFLVDDAIMATTGNAVLSLSPARP